MSTAAKRASSPSSPDRAGMRIIGAPGGMSPAWPSPSPSTAAARGAAGSEAMPSSGMAGASPTSASTWRSVSPSTATSSSRRRRVSSPPSRPSVREPARAAIDARSSARRSARLRASASAAPCASVVMPLASARATSSFAEDSRSASSWTVLASASASPRTAPTRAEVSAATDSAGGCFSGSGSGGDCSPPACPGVLSSGPSRSML